VERTIKKRQYGAYYTEESPFTLEPFRIWAKEAGLPGRKILEPFAGSSNIIRMLKDAGLCSDFDCYDVEAAPDGTYKVAVRNTLRSFPDGYHVCITNPPWLARNSARRRGLKFEVPRRYDDMYKYALDLALSHCDYVAFIIPATFLRAGLFRDRLHSCVTIERPLFYDTDNPVCLALFTPKPNRTTIWADDTRIGHLDDLEERFSMHAAQRTSETHARIRFNVADGNLGMWGVDNTREPSIRFCHGSELSHRTVKDTDRAIARIDPGIAVTAHMIDKLNEMLAEFRRDTHDVFLAPFKGLREDGRYRRRLDFAVARMLIMQYTKLKQTTIDVHM